MNRSRWTARLFVLTLTLGLGVPVVGGSEANAQQKTSVTKVGAQKVGAQKRSRRYSARRSRARSAKLARARAVARAREMREASVPRFRLDENGSLIPDLRAAAAIIFNPLTNQILWEQNANDTRSMASITKVMTALVYMESQPDLADQITIDRSDVRHASTTYLRAAERVSADDLMHLLLIASDNAAARALARSSSHGSSGFIARMNEKAVELGFESMRFSDPSGLNSANVATAYDISRLIAVAAQDPLISEIMRKPGYTFTTSRRTVRINSTNKLLGGDLDIMGAKTGFIRSAGYCFATLMKLPQGDPVAVVVLGARSNAGRFMETKHLFNWFSDKARGLFTNDNGQPKPQD
jgi:D-alanyl-D-alanine endopeptidase (penicillin-binding protein 7)